MNPSHVPGSGDQLSPTPAGRDMTDPAPVPPRASARPAPPHRVPLTVLVMAKEPVPGRVKTRLTPPFSEHQAATLAEAALADTLSTVAALPVSRRVLVLRGGTGDWLPAGFDVVPQVEGGLDERIAAAFAGCQGPVLLVGMDTPQFGVRELSPLLARDAWAHVDAWYGPATDGGFWALALANPQPALVRGVPMSRPDTGALQRQRLVEAGLRVADLPELTDVDTAQDAVTVAALSGGRFAREHARALAAQDAEAKPTEAR